MPHYHRQLLVYGLLVMFCILYILMILYLRTNLVTIQFTKRCLHGMIGDQHIIVESSIPRPPLQPRPFPRDPNIVNEDLISYSLFLLGEINQILVTQIAAPVGLCMEGTLVYQQTRTKGVVFTSMNVDLHTMYVVFEGTRTNEEWNENFQFSQVPLLYEDIIKHSADEGSFNASNLEDQQTAPPTTGRVHCGFASIYAGIRSQLLTLLSLKMKTWHRLVCVGHSLGAALAVIAATDHAVVSMFGQSIVCVAIACPRIGDHRFADSISQRSIFRLVNEADIINDIPLAVMPNRCSPESPLMYEHVGQRISCHRNNGGFIQNHLLSTYDKLWKDYLLKNSIPS